MIRRHRLAKAVQDPFRKMSSANPRWGSPRIVGELAKLGNHVAKGDRREVHGQTSPKS